jgi:hypothetical protein
LPTTGKSDMGVKALCLPVKIAIPFLDEETI